MEENYILAKWLNNELTEPELTAFRSDPDFEKYEKIKNYTSHLEVPSFNGKHILENVLNSKKINKKVIPLYNNWLLKIAAVFIIGFGITFYIQNTATQTQYALNGKKTAFLLPDDSQVVLNAGSEIEYKKNNWNKDRNLELQGEAYFKVAKGKKFEVTTSLGKVAVLGTQFNVKARKNRFDVICFEGMVRVNYNNSEMILTPGHGVTFENGKQINTSVDVARPEWLANNIAFNNEKLENIVAEIQRQYNVTIDVKVPYSDNVFTGKIPTDNLDIALQIIATTYNLEPKKVSATKIIFEGK